MPDEQTVRLDADECVKIKALIAEAQAFRESAWSDWTDDESLTWFTDKPRKFQALVSGYYWDMLWKWKRQSVRRSVNKILPKLLVKHAMMTAGERTFMVSAMHKRFEGLRKDVASFEKVLWARTDADQGWKNALWDCLNGYGFGVVEVGWKFERSGLSMTGGRGEPVLPEGSEPLDMQNPNFGEQEIPEGTNPEDMMAQQKIDEADLMAGEPVVDAPFVERFCPDDFFIDPNCRCWDLSDARYVVRVKYEPLERVKRNSKWKNTKDLTGAYYTRSDAGRYQQVATTDKVLSESSSERYVQTFHVYRWQWIKDEEIIVHSVFCNEHEKPLHAVKYEYVDDDGQSLFVRNPFPFRMVPDLVIDNDLCYPFSAVEQAEQIQLAHDEAWNQLQNHRRKSNKQYLSQAGAFTDEEKKRLQDGEDGAVIECEKFDMARGMTLVPQPQLDSTVYAEMKMTDPDMELALGVSKFFDTQTPDRKMLKAEITSAQQQGSTRPSSDVDKARDFASDIATCLTLLFMKFGDIGWEYKSKEGGNEWGVMDAEKLRGKHPGSDEMEDIGIQYEIKVSADSEQHKNKQQDATQKIAWFEKCILPFANLPDPDDPTKKMVDLKAALKIVSESMDIPNTEDIMAPTLSEQEKAAKNTPANQVTAIVQQNPQLAPLIMQFVQKIAQQAQAGQHGKPGGNGGQQPQPQQQMT